MVFDLLIRQSEMQKPARSKGEKRHTYFVRVSALLIQMKKRIYILFIVFLILLGINQKFAPNGKTQEKNDFQTKSAAEKPPMFVLQIGIGKYLYAPELKGSRFDVEGMKEVLTGERFGVPKNNIHTLLDEQATKERIIKEFENHLIKNARDYYE